MNEKGTCEHLFNSKYAVNVEQKTALCSKLFPFKEGPQDLVCVAETSQIL